MESSPFEPSPLFSRKRLRALIHRSPSGTDKLQFFTLARFMRGYTRRKAAADAKAGMNVALLDFPQGMAYALIAGLPFYCGIYASAVAAIIGPMLASSRFVMLGPTNAIAVLFLSSFMAMQVSPEQKLAILPLLLLMVAGFLILGALLRVATVIHYISRSVITGYICAAALLIIVNQLKHVLGIELAPASSFFGVAWQTVLHLPQTHWPALTMGAVTLLGYLLLHRFAPRLPTIAICLLVAFLVTHVFNRHGWHVATLAPDGISLSSFSITLPVLSFDAILMLAGPALAIAFLSMLESASIAKVLAARAGDRVDIRQQMLSMGAANVGCAFTGGMPISGSLTRSALNWSSGAQSPLSSVFSGSILVALLLVLGPWLGDIPLPALAVLVITIGVRLINPANIRMVLGTTNADATVFLTTFLGGLILPLDTAIYIGAAVSIVSFLHKASRPKLTEFSMVSEAVTGGLRDRPEVALLHVEGDLFFGSSDIFLDQARRICTEPRLRIFLLRLRNAHNLDTTCAMAIEELVHFARKNQRDVLICGAHPEVMEILRDSGLGKLLGEDHVFAEDPENPNLSTRNALRKAQQLLGSDAEIRLFVSDKGPQRT